MDAWLGGKIKAHCRKVAKQKKQLPYLLQNSGGSNGSEEVKNLAIMSHIIIGTLALKIVCVKFYNYFNHCGSNVPIWMSMFILAFVLVRWPSHALSCLVYVFFFAVNESQQDRVTDSISVVVKKVIRHFSHRRQMSEEGQI